MKCPHILSHWIVAVVVVAAAAGLFSTAFFDSVYRRGLQLYVFVCLYMFSFNRSDFSSEMRLKVGFCCVFWHSYCFAFEFTAFCCIYIFKMCHFIWLCAGFLLYSTPNTNPKALCAQFHVLFFLFYFIQNSRVEYPDRARDFIFFSLLIFMCSSSILCFSLARKLCYHYFSNFQPKDISHIPHPHTTHIENTSKIHRVQVRRRLSLICLNKIL